MSGDEAVSVPRCNPRSRCWVFTVNNPENPPDAVPFDESSVVWAVWQLERGEENGTPHIQGFVRFKSQRTFTQVAAMLPGSHLEAARGGDRKNLSYCTKEDTRVDGPWFLGTPPDGSQGRRSDWHEIKDMCKRSAPDEEIAERYPGHFVRHGPGIATMKCIFKKPRSASPEVWVIYGPPGTGKSHWAHEILPQGFEKQPGKWWDGYDGQEEVILDEFSGWISFTEMKLLLDKYTFRGEIKGRYVTVPATKVAITSNVWPDRWWDVTKETVDWQAFVRRVTHWVYFTGYRSFEVFEKYSDFFQKGTYPSSTCPHDQSFGCPQCVSEAPSSPRCFDENNNNNGNREEDGFLSNDEEVSDEESQFCSGESLVDDE